METWTAGKKVLISQPRGFTGHTLYKAQLTEIFSVSNSTPSSSCPAHEREINKLT